MEYAWEWNRKSDSICQVSYKMDLMDMHDRTDEIREMEEKMPQSEKDEIIAIMGSPCPNCGSFNILVRTRFGKSFPRGSKDYNPTDVEYTFCNMCGHQIS